MSPRPPCPPRALAAGACLVLLALPAPAQDGQKYLTLLGIPNATVAPGGLGFAQLAGTTRAANDKVDGSMALGFGIGDAVEGVGVQVTAQITSLTDDFADSGYIQFKFSRALGDSLYLGLQADHVLNWGEAEEIEANAKVMVSWFGTVQAGGEGYPVMVTLGAGNRVRNFDNDPGVFGGVGVGLSDRIGASIAWQGDYLSLGLGVRAADNLFLSATVEDLLDHEDRRSLAVSATYTFNLFGR